MSAPTCSIVIRAYNEEKHIGRLLSGIMQQTIKDVEILLVDSGSTDATVAIASRFPVRVIHIQPEEFTFGRSLNRGLSDASGDIVVIASAHVYPVYVDWLEKLIAPLASSQVGLTYGKQRGGEKSYFSEQQIFHHWYPDRAQPDQSHPFCNNANAAVKRSLWQQHAYDETLPGLEDLEWANWAIHSGFRIAYVPEAEVIHIHAETPRGVYNRYRREAMAFKRIFPHESFHLWDFARLFVSNAVSDAMHALGQKKLMTSVGSIFWFRWMQFWGTYQGYRKSGPLTWQLKQTFYYPNGLQMTQAKREQVSEPVRYDNL